MHLRLRIRMGFVEVHDATRERSIEIPAAHANVRSDQTSTHHS